MTVGLARDAFASDEDNRRLAAELLDALRTRTGDGVGITRLAYSERESAALDIFDAKAREFGFATERDAGANLVMTMEGSDPTLPFLACGSHLDSVPRGGNFDGAAGVIAGLATLTYFKAEGFVPRRTVKVYGLRGEESARFGKAYMGSSALFGKLTAADLARPSSDDGRTMADCMREVGVDVGRVEQGEPLLDPKSAASWIELHIEQGPVLVERNLPIGIVTGIRGNVRHCLVECLGEAGHSGAIPRALRRDAVFATAALISNLDHHWRSLLERGQDLVVTSGVLGTNPQEHAITRIPGSVRFSFEVRSHNKKTLEAFYDLFRSECTLVSAERGVEFKFDQRLEAPPIAMDSGWIDRLKTAARSLDLPQEEIPSGAGHDAAVFADAGIPSAMVFVRNEHGSHTPHEAMEIDDFLAGIAVMRAAIKEAVK